MPRTPMLDLGDIDVSPRPFRHMPGEGLFIEDMNLFAYEDIAKAASSREQARTTMLKAAIKATKGNTPEEQVDYVEAYLPVIEQRIEESLSKAATHLGIRASQAAERELRKAKSKRKKLIKLPVYKFVERHGGSGPLLHDTQNCYLVWDNSHMNYMVAGLREQFGNKFSTSFQVMPHVEKCDGETYRTKQVCLVIRFMQD